MIGWLVACHPTLPTLPDPVEPVGAAWVGPPGATWAGQRLAAGKVHGEPVVLVGGPSADSTPSVVALLAPDSAAEIGGYRAERATGLGSGLAFHPDGQGFAVGESSGAKTGFQEGVVYVFDQLPVGTEPLFSARLTLFGDSFRFAQFGVSVAYVDTGTGLELVAAASTHVGYEGVIYAFDPDLTGTFGLDAAQRRIVGQPGLGKFLAGWDSDGDGREEVVAATFDGVVHFASPWQSDLVEADADVRWATGLVGDIFEPTVLDDLDGDGLAELAIATPSWTGPEVRSGALYVVEGGGELLSGPAADLPFGFVGSELGEAMGRSVTTGDFDGDGIVDLAIGASGVYPAADQTGKVLGYLGPVVPGRYAATDADFVVQGENVYDMFGTALVTVDADGDARDDLVVGAQGWNGGQGKVYLFHAVDVLP